MRCDQAQCDEPAIQAVPEGWAFCKPHLRLHQQLMVEDGQPERDQPGRRAHRKRPAQLDSNGNPGPGQGRRLPGPVREQIRELWLAGHSAVALGRQFGVSNQTVGKIVREPGGPLGPRAPLVRTGRPNLTPTDRETVYALWQDGWEPALLAARFRVCVRTIHRTLRASHPRPLRPGQHLQRAE